MSVSFGFTTLTPEPPGIPPILLTSDPNEAETGVPRDATLVYILQDEDTGIDLSTVELEFGPTGGDDEAVVVGGVVQTGGGWTGSAVLSAGNTLCTITLTPPALLEVETAYEAAIEVSDLDANAASFLRTFTTSSVYTPEPEIPSHCAEAIDRVIAQLRGKPLFEGVICALVDPLDEIEAASLQVRELRNLVDGEGAQLDGIGQIVGQAREGQTDAVYRRFLAARILLNRSTGMPEELGAILEVLLDGASAIRIERHYPAATVLRVLDPIPIADGEAYARLLREAPPAGTRLILEYLPPATPLWTWAEWGADPAGATPLAEWGEDPTGAGILAEATDAQQNEV